MFEPGKTPVLTSGAIVEDEERRAMQEAVDKGWLTGGERVSQFEGALAVYTGHKHVISCNSGSSANLIAVGAMVEAGYWNAGDEILCVAASFPTTVNPLMFYGLVPVFVDITLPEYGPNIETLKTAVSLKTKGVMIAHTLGIPFDLDAVYALAKEHGLRVIEDCCDALGSLYKGELVGTRADLSTVSFFPAHHITTGEGGAVFTNSGKLKRLARSVRDWGRDCYCDPGQENACGIRFRQSLGTLPQGYDHKYTYSTMGFNLKIMEIAAAMGVEQVKKIERFERARKENFARYSRLLQSIADRVMLPVAPEGTDPSWFGFPITINQSGLRRDLQVWLDERKIGTRLVFGGNLLRQPYMIKRQDKYRVVGSMENTDKITNDSLWLGVYEGVTEEMAEYVAKCVVQFFDSRA